VRLRLNFTAGPDERGWDPAPDDSTQDYISWVRENLADEMVGQPKFEDMCRVEGDSGLVWGASEANARVPKPASLFFSRDFSQDSDFHSYLPDGYRDSMLMLIQTPNATTVSSSTSSPEDHNSPVVWYPPLPSWAHWDKSYSWHWYVLSLLKMHSTERPLTCLMSVLHVHNRVSKLFCPF